MSITVYNVNGTSGLACKCGSWLAHWKRFSGAALPTWCVEATCREKPTVGAHVQKASDPKWYIIPLCDKHNAKATSMQVMDSTVFVSANVSETCGRR